MRFKTTAEDGERGGSSNVRWKTVPQTSDCDAHRKRSVATAIRLGLEIFMHISLSHSHR